MRNKLKIIILLFLLGQNVFAEEKDGIRFGAVWGFSPQLVHSYHNNFKTEIGYRIDSRSTDLEYASNGYCEVYVGMNLTDRWMLSLLFGYEGITTRRRVFPLKIRATYSPSGKGRSGFVAFAEGGLATHEFKFDALVVPFAAGAGYRHSLSGNVSLDVHFSLKATYDQPGIIDRYYGKIPSERIVVNDAWYLSPTLGLAINF